MKKFFVFSLLCCVTLFTAAQIPGKKVKVIVNPIDVPNSMYELYQGISEKLYAGIQKKKINAQSSESPQAKMTWEQVVKLGTDSQMVQIIDPAFNDPYSLIDTMLYFPFESQNLVKIQLTGNYIKYYLKEDKLVYLPRAQAESILSEQERALLNYAHKHWKGELSKDIIISGTTGIASAITKSLYDLGLKNQVKPYRSDSLVTHYSPVEVKQLGSVSESWQIVNPETPDDPYNLIDTVLVTPFASDSMHTFMLSIEFTGLAPYGYKMNVNAMAPLYRPILAGIELGEQAMFWIKSEDILKYLSKEQNELLSIIVPYTVRRTLGPLQVEHCIPYSKGVN